MSCNQCGRLSGSDQEEQPYGLVIDDEVEHYDGVDTGFGCRACNSYWWRLERSGVSDPIYCWIEIPEPYAPHG